MENIDRQSPLKKRKYLRSPTGASHGSHVVLVLIDFCHSDPTVNNNYILFRNKFILQQKGFTDFLKNRESFIKHAADYRGGLLPIEFMDDLECLMHHYASNYKNRRSGPIFYEEAGKRCLAQIFHVLTTFGSSEMCRYWNESFPLHKTLSFIKELKPPCEFLSALNGSAGCNIYADNYVPSLTVATVMARHRILWDLPHNIQIRDDVRAILYSFLTGNRKVSDLATEAVKTILKPLLEHFDGNDMNFSKKGLLLLPFDLTKYILQIDCSALRYISMKPFNSVQKMELLVPVLEKSFASDASIKNREITFIETIFVKCFISDGDSFLELLYDRYFSPLDFIHSSDVDFRIAAYMMRSLPILQNLGITRKPIQLVILYGVDCAYTKIEWKFSLSQKALVLQALSSKKINNVVNVYRSFDATLCCDYHIFCAASQILVSQEEKYLGTTDLGDLVFLLPEAYVLDLLGFYYGEWIRLTNIKGSAFLLKARALLGCFHDVQFEKWLLEVIHDVPASNWMKLFEKNIYLLQVMRFPSIRPFLPAQLIYGILRKRKKPTQIALPFQTIAENRNIIEECLRHHISFDITDDVLFDESFVPLIKYLYPWVGLPWLGNIHPWPNVRTELFPALENELLKHTGFIFRCRPIEKEEFLKLKSLRMCCEYNDCYIPPNKFEVVTGWERINFDSRLRENWVKKRPYSLLEGTRSIVFNEEHEEFLRLLFRVQ